VLDVLTWLPPVLSWVMLWKLQLSLVTSSVFLNFILIANSIEKVVSHSYVVGNGMITFTKSIIHSASYSRSKVKKT